jgi:N6-adenosine-specific RNA methylase IME4
VELRINPVFRDLLWALAPEERQQLEANILEHGCRDPLVLWRGFLIDGHNRYAICTKHGLPFQTVEIDLPDEDAVEDWIDANQLGRRNGTPDQMKLALGRRYNRMKKKQGGTGANQHTEQSGQFDHSAKTAKVLAKEHGVSPKTVRRAAEFAMQVEKNPVLQEAIANRQPVLQVKRKQKEQAREAKRQHNRQLIETTEPERIAAVDAKFATIVIDPPWDWGDEGDQDQLGRARPDYATMSLAELEALDVCKHADENAHIYLWITNRSLPKGFRLLEAWGFRYITCITWVKPHFGMGNYFRGQTEHVLFGVRGSQPLKRKDAGTVFHAPRGDGGHSSKPTAFHDLVESCSPGPYLEMFSRLKRSGWATWGEGGYDYTA